MSNPLTPEQVILQEFIKESIKALMTTLTPYAKDLHGEIKLFLEDGTKKYYERKIERNLYIKTILHRSQPVNFFDIYQPTTLKFKDIEFIPKKIDDLFDNGNFISIIGEAGSGKSMFAKYLFLTALKEGKQIPLIIELRYLEQYNKLLDEYIIENIYNSKITDRPKILERLLKNGKFLIILDGYDEISSFNIQRITRSINLFIEDYPHNNYFLSSRPYANAESIPSFKNYAIMHLSKIQIHEFIAKQGIENEIQEKILLSINAESNLDTSFLKNPLLLSLFLLTFKTFPNIPTKKSIFYRRVIDVLFKEHDSVTKFGFERALKSNLSQENIEEILKIFSFITYCDSKFSFDKDYFLRLVAQIKKINSTLHFSGENLLEDLKIGLSFWLEDGMNYSFAHRSIQEYLAVLYVQGITTKKQQIYSTIQDKVCTRGLTNETYNFLRLLNEIDEYGYNYFIYLPSLKSIQINIESINPLLAILKLLIFKINLTYTNEDEIGIMFLKNKKSYLFVFEMLGIRIFEEFQSFLVSSQEVKSYCLSLRTPDQKDNNSNLKFEFDLDSEHFSKLVNMFELKYETQNTASVIKNKIISEIKLIKSKIEEYSNSEELVLNLITEENLLRGNN